MEKFVAASKFAFSIALIVMAASIYNFTQEARQLRLELPTLLAQVDSTAQKITPVIQEIKISKKLCLKFWLKVKSTRDSFQKS